jgi:ABC-type branched-subunit amino acid transport system substrate-binding protein
MAAVRVAVLLCALVLLASCTAAQQRRVKLLVIGNFGAAPGATNTNTFPSPALPTGSMLPVQTGWQQQVQQAIASVTSAYPNATFDVPVVLNTEGRITTAVSRLSAATANQTFDVAIISENYDVSTALQAAIVEQYGPAMMIVMALVDSPNLAFSGLPVGPSSARTMVSDTFAASRLVDTLEAVKWQAYSVLYTSDSFGDTFVSQVDAAMALKAVPPKMAVRERLSGWSAPTRDADDEKVLLRALQSGATGVLAIGHSGTAARILSAAARVQKSNPDAANLFFVFYASSMPAFPALSSNSPQNHAVFTPTFTSAADLKAQRIVDNDAAVTDGFAFQLSYVLDAIGFVGAAAAAVASDASSSVTGPNLLSKALMLNTTFKPTYTGTSLRLTAARNRADDSNFTLMQLAPTTEQAKIIATTPATGAPTLGASSSIVPLSTQKTVTVCVVGSDNCADYANVNHAIFRLLDSNKAAPFDTLAPKLPASSVYLDPVAISGGSTGVKAIAALAQYAHRCDFMIGPGRTSLTIAMNPMINYYAIPTIDFGSTSTELSDKLVYPYFSRTIANDLVLSKAIAGTFKKFGWDSVTIITTLDAYGNTFVQEFTKSFAEVVTGVEKSYYVDPHDDTNSSITTALKDIRDNLITRIVVVAISLSDAQMQFFFDGVGALNMRASHVFVLSDALCQLTGFKPQLRQPLLGSICVLPRYDNTRYSVTLPNLLTQYSADTLKLMAAGGYDTTTCDQSYVDLASAYAYDAAAVVVDTITRMYVANGNKLASPTNPSRTIFANTTDVVRMLRQVSLDSAVTYKLALDKSTGERLDSSFSLMIQQPRGVVNFGMWSQAGGLQLVTDPITWADNTTNIPKASTRSFSFIASKTAKSNPGVIAVSVLGFIITIAVFVFCCRYAQLQKKVAGLGTATDFESGGHGGVGGAGKEMRSTSRVQLP